MLDTASRSSDIPIPHKMQVHQDEIKGIANYQEKTVQVPIWHPPTTMLTPTHLGGDPVEISLSLGGEGAATVGGLLDQLQGLKSLKSLTGNRARASAEVAGLRTATLPTCGG